MNIEQKVRMLEEFVESVEWKDKRKMLIKKTLVFYADSRENMDRARVKMEKAVELIEAAVELSEVGEGV